MNALVGLTATVTGERSERESHYSSLTRAAMSTSPPIYCAGRVQNTRDHRQSLLVVLRTTFAQIAEFRLHFSFAVHYGSDQPAPCSGSQNANSKSRPTQNLQLAGCREGRSVGLTRLGSAHRSAARWVGRSGRSDPKFSSPRCARRSVGRCLPSRKRKNLVV